MSKQIIKTDYQRDLLLRVCDGFTQLAPLLFYINSMRRVEDACKWLIRNNLTGRNLYALWFMEYDKSYLKIMSRINQGLDKDDQMRSVRAGRDIL